MYFVIFNDNWMLMGLNI